MRIHLSTAILVWALSAEVAQGQSGESRTSDPDVRAPAAAVRQSFRLDAPQAGSSDDSVRRWSVREAERRVGVRGTVIGGVLGAAAGIALAAVLCDASDCVTHPDTVKLVGGSVAAGALLGGLIDLLQGARLAESP